MSQVVKNWTDWLNNTRFSSFSEEQRAQTFGWLFSVRDRVLANAKLNSGNVVVDIGTGTGLLAFGAYDILHGSRASSAFSDYLLPPPFRRVNIPDLSNIWMNTFLDFPKSGKYPEILLT